VPPSTSISRAARPAILFRSDCKIAPPGSEAPRDNVPHMRRWLEALEFKVSLMWRNFPPPPGR